MLVKRGAANAANVKLRLGSKVGVVYVLVLLRSPRLLGSGLPSLSVERGLLRPRIPRSWDGP